VNRSGVLSAMWSGTVVCVCHNYVVCRVAHVVEVRIIFGINVNIE
jgi:hypothetical protein